MRTTWHHLTIREWPDGRLGIEGLPADREERLSVVLRLIDTLAAVRQASAPGVSSGELWQRYARASWQADVTVTLVPAERDDDHGA